MSVEYRVMDEFAKMAKIADDPDRETVLVLFTYENGYPTMPLGVYLDVDAAPQYPDPWSEIPGGWNGRGGYTTTHHDGRAMELVRYVVSA